MKIRNIILPVLLLLITASCSNDDDVTPLIVDDSTLSGTWNLKRSDLVGNEPQIHEEVVVTYTFDNGTLTVVNNAVETTDFGPKASGILYSGVYSYLIFEFNGNAYLVVENDQFGQAEIGIMTLNSENSLILDQTEVPLTDNIYEYVLTFER